MKKVSLVLFIVILLSSLLLFGCSQPQPAPSTTTTPQPAPATSAAPQPSSTAKPSATVTTAPPSGGSTIELSFTIIQPPSAQMLTLIGPSFADKISQATNGRVKLKLYADGVLCKAAATYDAVESGIADIGWSMPSYTPGKFPLMELLEVPGLSYNNCMVSSLVANDIYKKYTPQSFSKTKILLMVGNSPGVLHTKNPIKNQADLKGVEIRAVGPSGDSIKLLGGVPVAMPMPDAYMALEKGVVKGILCPLDPLQAFKLAEVTKYTTVTNFLYNSTFFYAMNLNKWNSLPADVQAAIQKVSDSFALEHGKMWESIEEQALTYAAEKTGHQSVKLDAGETEKWQQVIKPVMDSYSSKTVDGVAGKDVAAEAIKLVEKYNAQYPMPAYYTK
jgi:TRAP-type transport system periplasmic protein